MGQIEMDALSFSPRFSEVTGTNPHSEAVKTADTDWKLLTASLKRGENKTFSQRPNYQNSCGSIFEVLSLCKKRLFRPNSEGLRSCDAEALLLLKLTDALLGWNPLNR